MDSAPDRDAVFQPWVSIAGAGAAPSPATTESILHHGGTFWWWQVFMAMEHLSTSPSCCSCFWFLFAAAWLLHLHLSALFTPFIKAFVRSPGLNQGLHSHRCIDLGTTWSSIYGYYYSIKPLVLLLCHYLAGAQSWVSLWHRLRKLSLMLLGARNRKSLSPFSSIPSLPWRNTSLFTQLLISFSCVTTQCLAFSSYLNIFTHNFELRIFILSKEGLFRHTLSFKSPWNTSENNGRKVSPLPSNSCTILSSCDEKIKIY